MFKDRLSILAFPCNQFLYQENSKGDEILKVLKHVRPGSDFEPKFEIFGKVEVNGRNTDPLFQFLRESLPFAHDEPNHLISDPKLITWSPVMRNDIGWNFEKFLVAPDGVPFKRYSSSIPAISLKGDIESLLQN